jgi:hypothetical protein
MESATMAIEILEATYGNANNTLMSGILVRSPKAMFFQFTCHLYCPRRRHYRKALRIYIPFMMRRLFLCSSHIRARDVRF